MYVCRGVDCVEVCICILYDDLICVYMWNEVDAQHISRHRVGLSLSFQGKAVPLACLEGHSQCPMDLYW